MRQKIASDIIRNIGTGKWCETTASINCFRTFRSYESKEVKKLHLWYRMNPFNVIKVMRNRRSKSEGNIWYLIWPPRLWAMKLVTGTARLHMELCLCCELDCFGAGSAAMKSHLVPGVPYVMLSVSSSKDLRDCGQICFGLVRWDEDKYWITE